VTLSAEAEADVPHEGFSVRVGDFEGPFDLLLSLISKHKLEVTELALHQVTDEFIAYIKGIKGSGGEWDLDEASSFLVVAATLLDLKAARLLPSGEVEDEEDLALLEARDLLFARLLQYRAYKEVSAIFAEQMESAGKRLPRTVSLEPQFAALLPEVLIGLGPEQFAALAALALAPKDEPQVGPVTCTYPRSVCASRPPSSWAGCVRRGLRLSGRWFPTPIRCSSSSVVSWRCWSSTESTSSYSTRSHRWGT